MVKMKKKKIKIKIEEVSKNEIEILENNGKTI